jgi:hypothetical protein
MLIPEANHVKDAYLYQCQIADNNFAECTENYVRDKKAVQGSVSVYVILSY